MAISSIFAAIGKSLGDTISLNRQSADEKEEINFQKRLQMEKLSQEESRAKKSFSISQAAAFMNSKRADFSLDKSASRLETSYNNLTADYNLNAEAQGLKNSMAQMSLDQSLGSAYAGLGYSGVRSSSTNYEAAANEQNLYQSNLENALRAQAIGNERELQNSLQSMDSGFYELSEGRRQVQDLRQAYQEGGKAYGAFQDQMTDFARERNTINELASRAEKAANPTALDYATIWISGGQTAAPDIAALFEKKQTQDQYGKALPANTVTPQNSNFYASNFNNYNLNSKTPSFQSQIKFQM